ncbi:MAG: diguanylate cyclase domain-containing protein [Acidimicrobiales bacterium]
MSPPLAILLVEDSPLHAKMVAALLARAPGPGYRVHHVVSVAGALAALGPAGTDCVLVDLHLPDAGRLEAVAQIGAAAPLVPVVVITSSSDEALALEAITAGAQDYLVKGRLEPDGLARSISWAMARKALSATTAHDALHDPLTHLPNRTLLLDRLHAALDRSARSSATVALMFVDLDRFKPVNDNLGHDAGDRVLRVVADRLRAAVRPQDTVARLGGDEFVVVCEGAAEALGERGPVARRIAAAVAAPIHVGGRDVQLAASIGVSLGGREGDPEAMLREADRAMYRIKRSRR